jgi:NAD(P)-dependent dehydrogenase (short-subunit alcohol dehydrogenase family)
MELHLTGRTVLVTGASRDIGLGIAQGFVGEGCNSHLVAREADAIRATCDVDLRTLALDLSTDASRQQLTDAWPDIDVLANNAGDIPGGAPSTRARCRFGVHGIQDVTGVPTYAEVELLQRPIRL